MRNPLRNKAFALVLVLIVIVLTTTMAVLFLSSAGRERRGVDLYARSSQVRHLAGMSVTKVMGQINLATKEGTAASPVSWASQPGMVRTFQSGTTPKNVYKLYSWDNLIEPGIGFDPSSATEVPPAGWKANVGVFTDLNQPINDVYPIVDPRAEGTVPGFSINATNSAVSGSGSAAPMPVKWLYVLEDGQMVAPSGGSGPTATFGGAVVPTDANPIVGRVAFWTDDETSKVNINTASEGAYWDVPRSGSRDDLQFAGNPPVRYEFQRTPGHPAMTALSAVFPEFLTEAADPTQTRWGGNYKTQMQALSALTPRVSWGSSTQGSQGGTYPITNYNYNYTPARNAIAISTLPLAITLDSDRLYASVDDFWFNAPVLASPSATRDPNTPLAALGATEFQKRLFFLTSTSRAPETTLFETPRICLWPITWPNASSYFPYRTARVPSLTAPAPQDPNTTKLADINPKWITAEERLIAFCGTLDAGNASGGDRYFFQRKDPDSPVNDWTGITRNRDLVGYLTRLMGTPAPGFSGSLTSSWGGNSTANWMALNSLNYVRSMVNQATAPNAQEGIRYSFAGVSFRKGKIGGGAQVGATTEPNAKVVTPLRANIGGTDYTAAGSYPALEEVAVVFYAAKRNEPVPPADPTAGTDPAAAAYPEWRNPYNWQNLINLDGANGYPVGAQTTVMRAVMLLDFTGLEPGVSVFPTFWVKVKGPGFSVNGSGIGLPTSGGLVAQCVLNSKVSYGPAARPLLTADFTNNGSGALKTFSNSAPAGNTVWQLVSNDITVSPTALAFSFGGSDVTVEVYSCNPANVDLDPTGDPNRKIYQKTMNFSAWSGNLPMPMAPRWSMASRFYQYDASGTPVTSTTATGTLPGGTLLKTTPAASNPMTKFKRLVDPLWQPNPGFSTNVLQQLAPLPAPAAPGGPNTAWAWSEYAPMIKQAAPGSGSDKDRMIDLRSVDSVRYARPTSQIITYAYRGNLSGYSASAADPDDSREGSSILNQNISTNFRKRVEVVSNKDSNFFIDGYVAGAPMPANYTQDYFNYSEGAPRDSAPLLTPYDTVISMVNAPSSATVDRDPRLAAVSANDDFRSVKAVLSAMQPTLVIDAKYPRTTSQAQWHQFGTPGPIPNITGYQNLPTFRGDSFARRAYGGKNGGDLGMDTGYAGLIGTAAGSLNMIPALGDWTGMPGRFADGGLLTRPDQEYSQLSQDTSGPMVIPYYPADNYGEVMGTTSNSVDVSYFSPNRQVPSPVLLGTLPRSMTTGWQTLAFSPNPADPSHLGLASAGAAAPDHLLLDLFWMPVVEPYPISEQLSTAGKVNLNYRLMPFSYIERKTALHAALKSTWITALTDTANNTANYKSHSAIRDQPDSKTRYAVDASETLKGFDEIFDSGKILRSASELCEMFLVPKGESISSTKTTFWNSKHLTADNAREQPYNDLYSRVTTKSNTFTVHWRVQSLRKVPTGTADTWDETKDRVGAELRGATLIERYIDSNATNIPDYATTAAAVPLSNFYKWRVVSENFFQP